MSAYGEYYITILLFPVTIESIKFKTKKKRDPLKLRFLRMWRAEWDEYGHWFY